MGTFSSLEFAKFWPPQTAIILATYVLILSIRPYLVTLIMFTLMLFNIILMRILSPEASFVIGYWNKEVEDILILESKANIKTQH